MNTQYLPSVLIITLTLFGSGCANTQQYAALDARISRAQATADDALRQAKVANMKADEALLLIQGGNTRKIAEQALKEAQAAKKAAANASKRAERMFRKALAK